MKKTILFIAIGLLFLTGIARANDASTAQSALNIADSALGHVPASNYKDRLVSTKNSLQTQLDNLSQPYKTSSHSPDIIDSNDAKNKVKHSEDAVDTRGTHYSDASSIAEAAITLAGQAIGAIPYDSDQSAEVKAKLEQELSDLTAPSVSSTPTRPGVNATDYPEEPVKVAKPDYGNIPENAPSKTNKFGYEVDNQ